jgi:hypothetical protein
MKDKEREALLKIVAISCVGLLLLNWIVITPAINAWKSRSDRIDDLQKKVDRGTQLEERKSNIRARWSEMQRSDLPDDVSIAENDAFKAVGRWARDSKVTFTNLTPQWRNHEEGYDTLECRAAANGDQISLARFLYEMEVDPMPVALQECEITARDAQGQQLLMSVRFSFIRLAKTTASNTTITSRRAPVRQ